MSGGLLFPWLAACSVSSAARSPRGKRPARPAGRHVGAPRSSWEYLDLRCGASPDQKLDGWSQFPSLPRRTGPDCARSRSVSTRAATRAGSGERQVRGYLRWRGHPVSPDSRHRRSRQRRSSAHRHRPESPACSCARRRISWPWSVRNRYGDEGWRCHDVAPSGGETPVGGVFVKQHCEKTASGRNFVLDRAVQPATRPVHPRIRQRDPSGDWRTAN